MKVVVDTNVVLSALLTKGLTADVVQYCFESHEVYLSGWILNEIVEKLRDKFEISERQIERTIELLRTGAQVVDPEGTPPSVCRDEDDNNVLHVGHFVGAEYIITGDKDLLVLGEYGGVRLVTPRDFWARSRQAEI